MKQGTKLFAKHDFSFIAESKRKINVKKNDQFVVTNSSVDQQLTGLIKIDRSKSAKISLGHNFNQELIQSNFNCSL